MGVTITFSLVLTLMPIDYIIFNPNQRSFSLQHKESSIEKVQRSTDGGAPRPHQYVYHTTPAHVSQGTLWKKYWKEQEVCCEVAKAGNLLNSMPASAITLP